MKYTISLKGRFKPMIKDHTFKPMYAPVYTHRLKAMENFKKIILIMESEAERVAAAAFTIAVVIKKRKVEKKRNKRIVWVKPWLLRRENLGSAATLMEEFRREDKVEYGKFLRMLPEVFTSV